MDNLPEEQNLSWFIKDEAISDLKQDEFAHVDIARELKQKIKWLGPPLTISLESQHGTGKSVVGELLKAQFQSDPEYQFVRIEAWRHSGDSRRKAFLYDVIEELKTAFYDNKNDKAVADLCKQQEGLYHTASEQHAVLSFRGLRATWAALKAEARQPAIIRFTACVVLVLATLAIWVILTANTGIKAALLSMILAIPGVFSLAGVVYFGTMLSKMAESVLEPAKITFTTSPPTSSEQFEQIFREVLRIIGAASGEHGSQAGKTLVILVDELDRLPVDEIIQAINVVRTFRDVKPCVVIVALDAEVVVRALQQKPTESAGLIRNDEDAEEFLNKFFKFRQHLPPLVPGDMQAFARALIESGRLTGGVGSLKGTALDDVLDGLIHPGVTTPRHVIRLLNEFNSDLRLAFRRERSEQGVGNTTVSLLGQGAVTGNMPFLAVVTAMREDFSSFYTDTARNQELIRIVEDGLSGKFDGPDAIDLDEDYPGYKEICNRYFDSLLDTAQEPALGSGQGETTNPDRDIDWSKPLPPYRDLILHLQANRRFRATVVAPFIFFREDAAARALGSGEQAQRMATEFWSNAILLLRGRFDRAKEANQSGFSGGAATVALHCLADGRGSQRRNAALAVCVLIDRFDSSRAAELSDAVARTADDVISIIDAIGGELPADQFLRTLSAHPQGFHQERCISILTDRIKQLSAELSADDADDEQVTLANSMLRSISLYPDLFSSDQRRAAITELASAVSSRVTVEEAKEWLDLLSAPNTAAFIREEMFGPKAWQNLATRLGDSDTKTLPHGSTNSLGEAVIAVEQKAMAIWPREYIALSVGLLSAKSWGIRDVGFDILERQSEALDLGEATASLRAVIKSVDGGMDKRSDAAIIYPRIATWVAKLCDRDIGGEILHDKDIEAELDTHCAKYVVLAQDELRRACYSIFKVVAPRSETKYAKTSAALISFITDKRPAATAKEALETLIAVPAETAADEYNTLYLALSAPLKTLQAGDDAAFAATALLLGLEPNNDDKVRTAALTQAQALVPLLFAGHTPSQLEDIDRVVGRAIPMFSDTVRQTYVSGLNSLISTAGNSPQQLFALNRLEALRRDGTMPLTLIPVTCANLVSSWANLLTPESRTMAVQMLTVWLSNLPSINRDGHLANMASYANEVPGAAWEATVSFWSQMNTTQRVTALKSSWQGATQGRILEDISAEPNRPRYRCDIVTSDRSRSVDAAAARGNSETRYGIDATQRRGRKKSHSGKCF